MAGLVVLLAAACNKPFDLDGDDRADLVWVDSGDGSWHRYDPDTGTSSLLAGNAWYPVPGDYDGDGRWEVASASATQWVSSGRTPKTLALARPTGSAADIFAVQANWDGGNRTIPAWYRATDQTWFVFGHPDVQFGTADDYPVPADYDGDGTADLATWNPSTGVWHVRRSSDGTETSQTFGGAYVYPVPARWAGGRTDIPALFHWKTGEWEILGQPSRYSPVPPSDPMMNLPAAADYDGDGSVDSATATVDWASQTTWTAATLGAPITLHPSGSGQSVLPIEVDPDLVVVTSRFTSASWCVLNPGSC